MTLAHAAGSSHATATATATATAPASAIRVLLAEDETHLGTILEQYLTARGFAVTIVRNGRDALERLRAETFDVALLDVVMPELDGLEVLRLVREEPLPPEILVITGNGTIETALSALKLGAYDVLSKPYRMAEIDALVRRAWEKRMLARDNHVLQARLRRSTVRPTLVTRYAPLMAVLSVVDRVAASDAPVLISGEVGTGKNLVAGLLHERGARPTAPFLSVDLAAIDTYAQLVELFGLERGARPDADGRTLGLLELASGGTLYLDHVEALHPSAQRLLEQALESGHFCRVGGAQRVAVAVRVVASSSRDMARMAAVGDFDAALLHRLGAIRVNLPPLRERLTDIPLLAEQFAVRFGGMSPPSLTPDAVAVLERYRWPGNVRELRAVMERAVLLAVQGTIGARDLPLGPEVATTGTPTPTIPLTLDALERRHILDVLHRERWHQGRAAEMLGISPKTLYRKIREFGLQRPSGRR